MLFVILQLIFLPVCARSWDLAVAVNDHVELMNLTAKGDINTIHKIDFQEQIFANALAFDRIENVMYISDTLRGKTSGIYSVNLKSNEEPKLLIQEPVEDDNHSILGIVYDYVTKTLFWTNGAGKAILYLSPNGLKFERKVLHHLHKVTTGIALDVCSRTLYWTTGNGTIERSDINGSNHEVLFNDIHNPTDITVDQKLRKLYWCDDSQGIYFKIESSNLDGSSRKVLIHHINQKPVSIATTPTHIFWTDKQNTAMWSAALTVTGKESISLIYQVQSSHTRGLISQDNSILMSECRAQEPQNDMPNSDIIVNDEPILQTVKNKSLETCRDGVETLEKSGVISFPVEGFCLNGGTLERGETIQCNCPKGYIGPRCEQSQCHNYCINGNGNCYVDARGFAQCKCMKGYLGERCEQDVCKNFCLNGGRCEINGMENPVCKCGGGFQGRHCEINCNLFCQQGQFIVPIEGGLTPLCPCTSDGKYEVTNAENSSNAQLVNEEKLENESFCMNDDLTQPLIIGLGVLCILLLVVSLYLSRKVCVLRRRPRIKKRIIVSKNVTPLTSRPPPPGDQCEITIENCCNMNICETPCYEPQLRTSKIPSKTEEKKNLLGNMEEGSTCSPCQDNLY